MSPADHASRKGVPPTNKRNLPSAPSTVRGGSTTSLAERMPQNHTHLVVVNLGGSVDVDGLVELLCLRSRHVRLL